MKGRRRAAMRELKQTESSSESESSAEEPMDTEPGTEADQSTQVPAEPDKLIKPEWKNRTRVLVFCSRGSSYKDRHLMQDIRSMLPHAKAESKMDKKQRLTTINELAAMANCSKCLYFENRKRRDLYLWVSNVGAGGPSIKFLVHNVHTAGELRLTGNCLKGSRPLLSFDKTFDSQPHTKLVKEVLTQTFSVPQHHPCSQPFIDHVFNFAVTDDGKIWFRNYQIVDEKGQLEEIGPRMVLELVKVFEGSFGGANLYENPSFVNPNHLRRQAKSAASMKYINKVHSKKAGQERKLESAIHPTKDSIYEEVFDPDKVNNKGDAAHQLKRLLEKRKRRKKPKKPTGDMEIDA